MYTTSPVQPFEEKNDKNHDDGGNKKVYKWKMLVEKHKDDLRKLWDFTTIFWFSLLQFLKFSTITFHLFPK